MPMNDVHFHENVSISPNAHCGSISSQSKLFPVEHPKHPFLSGYTQTRSTPDGYIPQDAPTQQLHYLIPSAISQKDTRRGPLARSDKEDELAEDSEPQAPCKNATDQQKIEYKCRRNTLAVRRSRKQRLALFHKLKEDVVRLTQEKDIWRECALMMERMLSTHGPLVPNFNP